MKWDLNKLYNEYTHPIYIFLKPPFFCPLSCLFSLMLFSLFCPHSLAPYATGSTCNWHFSAVTCILFTEVIHELISLLFCLPPLCRMARTTLTSAFPRFVFSLLFYSFWNVRSLTLLTMQTLEAVKRLCPKQALLIGMTHEFDHYADNDFLMEWSKR